MREGRLWNGHAVWMAMPVGDSGQEQNCSGGGALVEGCVAGLVVGTLFLFGRAKTDRRGRAR